MSNYEDVAFEIAHTVEEKQAAYGDSFGKSGQIMRILYPNGVPPEQFNDALTVVRVLDKLFRVATRKGAFGESPWFDVMGYALLAVVRDRKAVEPQPGPASAQLSFNFSTPGYDANGYYVDEVL